jgi:tetratricopeptide (TPR) repeat protein
LAQVKPATEGEPLKNDDEYLCVSTAGPQTIPACDRYIKSNPPPDKLITALRQRGQAHLYDRDDFVTALADYEAALKIDPNNAATHEYIGNLYSRKSDYARAESSFNKAVQLTPLFTSGYARRAGVYIAMKDYDRALADLDKVVAINAKMESNKDWSYSVAMGYADRCNLRGLRGEYELALEDCNKALSFEPTYDSALVHRGEIYTYKKDFTRALADLNAAVQTGFEYPGKFRPGRSCSRAWVKGRRRSRITRRRLCCEDSASTSWQRCRSASRSWRRAAMTPRAPASTCRATGSRS